MSEAVDQLIEARDRIEDPSRWARWTLAQGPGGESVALGSPKATAWCAKGSLARTLMANGILNIHPHHSGMEKWFRVDDLCPSQIFLGQAARELFNHTVAYVNDVLGHDAVLKVYDRAIELAKDDALMPSPGRQ